MATQTEKAIRLQRPLLTKPERRLGLLMIVITLAWPIAAFRSNLTINWDLVALAAGLEGGAILLGLYARMRLKLEGLAKFGIAFGYFFITLTSVTNLISSRFPVESPAMDATLQRIDDSLGYSWPAAVNWLAEHPTLGNFLAILYTTSLFQIVLVMLVLALMRLDQTLYRMMVCGLGALLATVGIWVIWPSFGPGLFFDILPDVETSFDLIVHAEFREEMRRLVEQGRDSVPPRRSLGLVAFPSFHTIMALLVVWYSRRTWLFWPMLVLNILMLPSILIQGAHYVSDIAGGIIVFALAAIIAQRMLRGPETQNQIEPNS